MEEVRFNLCHSIVKNLCGATNWWKKEYFFEGFGSEYFDVSEAEASGEGYKDNEKGFFEAFKSVLGSKATEESLVRIRDHKSPFLLIH